MSQSVCARCSTAKDNEFPDNLNYGNEKCCSICDAYLCVDCWRQHTGICEKCNKDAANLSAVLINVENKYLVLNRFQRLLWETYGKFYVYRSYSVRDLSTDAYLACHIIVAGNESELLNNLKFVQSCFKQMNEDTRRLWMQMIPSLSGPTEILFRLRKAFVKA